MPNEGTDDRAFDVRVAVLLTELGGQRPVAERLDVSRHRIRSAVDRLRVQPATEAEIAAERGAPEGVPNGPLKSRMLKVECPRCGCVVRMARSWMSRAGMPACGCGARMTASVGSPPARGGCA